MTPVAAAFTPNDIQQTRRSFRRSIAACSRMAKASDDEKEQTLWLTNKSYLLGVLNQLERQWFAIEKGQF